MKIIILNWRDPKHPESGGAEQATLQHAKAWLGSGFQVTWFASKVSNLPAQEMIEGIKIVRRGYYVFGVQWEAYKFLKRNKYDLVVDQIHGLPFFTPLYLRKVPILAYIHEVTKEVVWHNPYPFPLNKLISLTAVVTEPLIFRIFYSQTQFMTVSASTKKDLKNWGVKKVEIVENGVSLPRKLQSLQKSKNKTLLYLGVLTKDKGVEDAIYVFNKLAQVHPGWNYWVVGKGTDSYVAKLKKKSCDKIKFFGFVPESQKYKLLSKAHVLINPSIREGWGLVNIEANSMGTPVVGYDVAGTRDSVLHKKTGVLVKLYDKDSLVMEVEKLLSSKKYRNYCKNSLMHAKKFTWRKSTKKSTLLLRKLLQSE